MKTQIKIWILGFYGWRQHAKTGKLFQIVDMGGWAIGNYKSINEMPIQDAWNFEMKNKKVNP